MHRMLNVSSGFVPRCHHNCKHNVKGTYALYTTVYTTASSTARATIASVHARAFPLRTSRRQRCRPYAVRKMASYIHLPSTSHLYVFFCGNRHFTFLPQLMLPFASRPFFCARSSSSIANENAGCLLLHASECCKRT